MWGSLFLWIAFFISESRILSNNKLFHSFTIHRSILLDDVQGNHESEQSVLCSEVLIADCGNVPCFSGNA